MDNQLYTIHGSSGINWFPQTIVEEILQNVSTILSTVAGSVPLNRNFGINSTFIDAPMPRAMARASIMALESIQEFEPRVEVVEIDFAPSENQLGGLEPRIVVRILDEYIT